MPSVHLLKCAHKSALVNAFLYNKPAMVSGSVHLTKLFWYEVVTCSVDISCSSKVGYKQIGFGFIKFKSKCIC